MAHIVGCVEAHELSTCKQGANQHAHHILRKNAKPASGGADPKPENTPMPTEAEKAAAQAEITKTALAMSVAIAKMNDVTKAHFLGLADDAQVAFLSKSAEDQDKEAAAAKSAKDKAAAEEEARKSGITATELELRKSNQELREEIEALKARDAERDVEKRAATEFAGYPGGVAEAVKKLKSLAKLPEDDRKSFEDLMKAQCSTAVTAMKSFGVATEMDLTKAQVSKKRVDEAADKYAADHKVSKAVAIEKVSEMREFAADIALIEEAGLVIG